MSDEILNEYQPNAFNGTCKKIKAKSCNTLSCGCYCQTRVTYQLDIRGPSWELFVITFSSLSLSPSSLKSKTFTHKTKFYNFINKILCKPDSCKLSTPTLLTLLSTYTYLYIHRTPTSTFIIRHTHISQQLVATSTHKLI